MRVYLVSAIAAALTFASCSVDYGSGPIEVTEITFAHGIDKEGNPVGPRDEFDADDKIYLHMKFKGRPRKGKIKTGFYFRDQLIDETSVDLSDVNEGIIFSLGQYTYANFHLTPTQPLPIGEGYSAKVLIDGELQGIYFFHVAPPEGAIPSQVGIVTLAKGVDSGSNPVTPSNSFGTNDEVFLVGRGDFGESTWLEANWFVNGQLDKSGTRSLTMSENAEDTPFFFAHLPEGGWPVGEHYVVLFMNGVEVGRYSFSVTAQALGSAATNEGQLRPNAQRP